MQPLRNIELQIRTQIQIENTQKCVEQSESGRKLAQNIELNKFFTKVHMYIQ